MLYLFRALLFPPQKPNRRAHIHHGRACNGVRALRALPDQGLQNGAGVSAYFHFQRICVYMCYVHSASKLKPRY